MNRAITARTLGIGAIFKLLTARFPSGLGRGSHHSGGVLTRNDFPFKNPDLDAQNAIGGQGSPVGVINVGSQGMQGNSTFPHPLSSSNFSPVEAATDLDFDPFNFGPFSPLQSLANHPSKGNPTL